MCLLAMMFSTHYAGYQGAIAARNILLPLTDPGVLEHVPCTTFTTPEVASIGMSHSAAIAKYGAAKIVVAERSLSEVDRAVCDGNQQGFIKIVYLKRNGHILGATIVAPSAGELISEIAVMMKSGMPFEQLATVMHPYPVRTSIGVCWEATLEK
jgi:pyruvate/2-oxoglutarate dehydrogenase complex dihydrolipoamide dehydrogenase (E3) component